MGIEEGALGVESPADVDELLSAGVKRVEAVTSEEVQLSPVHARMELGE
jgi:hypothetical protein